MEGSSSLCGEGGVKRDTTPQEGRVCRWTRMPQAGKRSAPTLLATGRGGGGGGRKALCACGMVRDAEIVITPGRGETGKLDVDGSLDGRRPGFPSLIFVVVEDASGVGCETE